MSGIKSNHRNLKAEDRWTEQDNEIHQRDLWGSEAVDKTEPSPSGEEMEVMAARDVTVNHHYPEPPKPAPAPAAEPAPKSQEAAGMSKLQQAIMAGSIALGAGGIGYGFANRTPDVQPNPPAINYEAGEYDLGLLPPDEPLRRQDGATE